MPDICPHQFYSVRRMSIPRINLGSSPSHVASVALALNLQTGILSPGFHIQFDDFFETVRPYNGIPPKLLSVEIPPGIRKKTIKGNITSEGSSEYMAPFLLNNNKVHHKETYVMQEEKTQD